MSEFLTQAQTLKAEAARLRAEPIADERRRDEAHSQATDMERQAYVEEILHDLARQPAIEPAPALDRRTAQMQAAQAELDQAQASVDAVQDQIRNVRENLAGLSRSIDQTYRQENTARTKVMELQQKVADLEDKEASFFVGRLLKIRSYQETVADLAAMQEALLEAEDLVGLLSGDLQRLEGEQEGALEALTARQADLSQALRGFERAQDRLIDAKAAHQDARREEMERRWKALEPAEQIRRIDERRLHERWSRERLGDPDQN